MPLLRFMALAILSMFSLMSRTDDPAPDPEADPDRPMTRRDFRAEVAAKVKATENQAELIDMITTLREENYKFRNSKHRLTPEQHAAWVAYQALGPVAELQAKIAAMPQLESDLATYRQAEKIERTAGKLGIKGDTARAAFAQLLGDRDFEIVEIPGQDTPQVLVVDGQNKTPIREFVKNNPRLAWAEPVIFAQDTDAHGAPPAGQPATAPTSQAHGAAFITQPAGTPPAAHGAIDTAALVEKYNNERNANRVNPLAKQTGA